MMQIAKKTRTIIIPAGLGFEFEISDDETCKIWYNTTLGEVKIEDLEAQETWRSPIDADGADTVAASLTPGFSNGKWAILIGKLIKEALT